MISSLKSQNMNYDLTVVIPMYNVIDYVVRSVESLGVWLNNKAVEILIIDDGSTDGSLSVAKNIEKTYDNVIVYHKENGGLSSARNFGYSLANGRYVYFFDSDDALGEGAAQILLNAINGSSDDLIMFGYDEILEDGNINTVTSKDQPKMDEFTLRKDDILTELLGIKQGFIPGYAPTKIFRTEAIKELSFREMYYEDLAFFMDFLRQNASDKYRFINLPLYKYYRRSGSITRQFSETKLMDKMTSLDLMLNAVFEISGNSRIVNEAFKTYFVGYLWIAKLNKDVSSALVSKRVHNALHSNRGKYFELFKGFKNFVKFVYYRTF
ncbi:glycosyltransferase family 2 protein [Weissella confusa]|uniref:Glycosyltransferase family 2 protein n=1 Tax=Weissella fermenti TaxID=2987699 RepID=A0ABT6D4K5_9LACO|nr:MULTISPECIES: glycosyltransferase family 2 protein [Weissella]MBJ7687544.1 glycosyltransferase family 2 protein [Weissella confusa]MDF9299914.1 glycosyltransferase family 2 protein [Weissella sp. BK2]